jgi:hypothetical protein
MKRIICTLLICFTANGLAAQLPVIDGFTNNDLALCRYNKYLGHFILTQESAASTGRFLYDSAFSLKGFYEYPNNEKQYGIYKKNLKPNFVAAVTTPAGDYEVFWYKQEYLIYKLDFDGKKDSLIYRFRLLSVNKDEETIAVLSNYSRLRILTYSGKTNSMYLYGYAPGDSSISRKTFQLPEKNLSKEAYKEYGDAGLVKIKDGFNNLSVTALNENKPFNLPGSQKLFYNQDKIYLLKKMKSNLGFTLFTLNEKEENVAINNFIINTWDELYSTNFEDTKYAVATITDTLLIISSSSRKKFEYSFYNVNSGALIKTHSVPVKDVAGRLFSSPLKGAMKDKKVSSQYFLDQLYAKNQVLSAAQHDGDSTTLTLCSVKFRGEDEEDMGFWLAGQIVNLLLNPSLLNRILFVINLDNELNVNAIKSYGESFYYVHTRFSAKTLEIGSGKHVWTVLDDLIQNRVNEILERPGSFLVPAGRLYYLGWFNPLQKKISLVQFY